MQTLLRFILRILFGFRAENVKALQTVGPVMLLPNHISWFDWLFLAACVDTKWRFVTSVEAARVSPVHRFIMINRFTFPVETDSPYAVKRMAEFLQAGGKLVLFPEGRLSRTGCLMKLFDGTGFLLYKTGAKVVTCYLRNAFRLPYSTSLNKKQLFPRVTAHFSEVLTPPKLTNVRTVQARARLTQWLYDTMVKQQFDVEMAASPQTVLGSILETARRWPNRGVIQDVSRRDLTYRRLLAGVDAMALQWRDLLQDGATPHGTSQSEPSCVGVMLPGAMAAPVTLLSLWGVNRAPAIFNFSTGVPTMLACAQLANVKQIITSRQFVERAKLDLWKMKEAGIQFIYLEDVRERITRGQRLRSLLRVSFLGLRPTPG